MKEQIKSRILIEMQDVLTIEQLKELKWCLDRNLYGVDISKENTALSVSYAVSNEEMIKRYYAQLVVSGKAQRTIEQYLLQIRMFFENVNKNWSEINKDDILLYLGKLMRLNTLSMVTIDNRRKCVKTFFNFLEDNDYIKKNPFRGIGNIKYEQKRKDYLTDDEIINIRDAIVEDESNKKIRDLAIVDFLLSTGVRVSELINIKCSDVDFCKGTVNVYATKTRDWRVVYLDSNAKKHLIDYMNIKKHSSIYLFGGRSNGKISSNTINNILKKYSSKANINKHCTVHLCRKTLATKLYKKGMDIGKIANILGHHSVKTTEQYYLTICQDDIYNTYKSIC